MFKIKMMMLKILKILGINRNNWMYIWMYIIGFIEIAFYIYGEEIGYSAWISKLFFLIGIFMIIIGFRCELMRLYIVLSDEIYIQKNKTKKDKDTDNISEHTI